MSTYVIYKKDKGFVPMEVDIPLTKEIPLKTLQEAVEGYIELFPNRVFERKKIVMFVNDYGLFTKKPSMVVEGQAVYGNAVFAGTNRYGDTIGLTDEQIEYINNLEVKGFVAVQSEDGVSILECY